MHKLNPRLNHGIHLLTSLVLVGAWQGQIAGQDPPLDKLVELNARELFGGEGTVKDGRVTLRFTRKETFARAFRVPGGGSGRGIVSNLDDLKEATMRGNVAGGLEANFSFAGLDAGEALSRFEMADDFTISFRMRAPVIAPGASFILRWNQEDSRNHVQTNFFQDLVVTEGGKPRRKVASDPRLAGPPSKWFHQKLAEPPATQVNVVFKDKKASVSLTLFEEPKKSSAVVAASQEAIEKPTRGKVFLKFSKLSFGMADFVIEGKYAREWAEVELARLRKEKKIRIRPEDPEPSEKMVKDNSKGKRGVDDKKAAPTVKKAKRVKRAPPDVGQPDPDAEVDL